MVEVTEVAATDEHLNDAESIVDELEDKYGEDESAMPNILLVSLATVMEAAGAQSIGFTANDGTEITVTYSPGRDPEEAIH